MGASSDAIDAVFIDYLDCLKINSTKSRFNYSPFINCYFRRVRFRFLSDIRRCAAFNWSIMWPEVNETNTLMMAALITASDKSPNRRASGRTN